jgi:hypothetical protein
MYAKENLTKISRMAVTVTTTISLLLISTIPSLGADSRPPQCLEVERIEKRKIEVRNKCGRAMSFKISYAFAPDSACMTIGRAYTKRYTLKENRRYDGLRVC